MTLRRTLWLAAWPARWLALILVYGAYEFRWLRGSEFSAAAGWLFPDE